jgi:inosose dehydratase
MSEPRVDDLSPITVKTTKEGATVPIKISNCPVSWAVEEADASSNAPWMQYLDEAARVGYDGVELGPLGYLPSDPHELRSELEARDLELSAGYVMEPLARPDALEKTLEVTRETASLLRDCGASVLVLIDDMYPERSSVAGRFNEAPRLGAEEMRQLAEAAETAARVAAEDFGLSVAFHPHVGTYVEFEDEIDAFLSLIDRDLIGLCVDTGHSVYAGVDPVALLAGNRDFARYFHLKDVAAEVLASARENGLSFDQAVAEGIFCPVGTGMVDYETFMTEVRAAGVAWAAVEQDRAPGATYGTTPLEDAGASRGYLETLGLKRIPG